MKVAEKHVQELIQEAESIATCHAETLRVGDAEMNKLRELVTILDKKAEDSVSMRVLQPKRARCK